MIVLLIQDYKKFGCPKYNPDQSLKLMYERLKNSKLDKKEKCSKREVFIKISPEVKGIDIFNLLILNNINYYIIIIIIIFI